jgi:hypothetical protein
LLATTYVGKRPSCKFVDQVRFSCELPELVLPSIKAASNLTLSCHRKHNVTARISPQEILKSAMRDGESEKFQRKNNGLLIRLSMACVCIFCNTAWKKDCDKESSAKFKLPFAP